MHRFVRFISGLLFSLGLAISVTVHASAAAVDPGGTLVEYDQNFQPVVLYAEARTAVRNLPVRF